jgi:Golgi phosphoprotein 3
LPSSLYSRKDDLNLIEQSMASASGLQRRRNAGAYNSSHENNVPTTPDRNISSESGVRVAVDPNDILDDEDKKQPNLTLMEEVLLLGLKDKQVN